MTTAAWRPARRADVAWVEVEGEAVLLDVASGELHLLNPTAALVWRLIDGEAAVTELVEELGDAFGLEPVHVQMELGGLLAGLADLGLLAGDEGTTT